jgi:hypothetical protein
MQREGEARTEPAALALQSLLAALDRLADGREALVVADEQARREESVKSTGEIKVPDNDPPDARATRTLLRAAADAVWLLETAAARAEAQPTKEEVGEETQLQRVLERADHVSEALELASALRCAHSTALARAQTYEGLADACAAHDVGALNLALVLFELEDEDSAAEGSPTSDALLDLLFVCILQDTTRAWSESSESSAFTELTDCMMLMTLAPSKPETPAAAATVRRLLECERIAQTAGRARANGVVKCLRGLDLGDWRTPLMSASENGRMLCVKALLACPSVRATAAHESPFGKTALNLASAAAFADTVAVLLTCPEVRAAAGKRPAFCADTALMFAAFAASARTTRVLLACPEVQRTAGEAGGGGRTALMLACDHVSILHETETETKAGGETGAGEEAETMQVLRELLACPEVQRTAGASDIEGRTALMRVCAFETPETAAALQVLLACPEVQRTAGETDLRGQTALMRACRSFGKAARIGIAALLACPEVRRTAGAVNRNAGNTALIIAASVIKNADVAAMLLACPEVRETANAVNTCGRTAFSVAAEQSNAPFLEALQRLDVDRARG